MKQNNQKLELKILDSPNKCLGIKVYIDRKRINALRLDFPDANRIIEDGEKTDFEFDVELEVHDIEDIALLMNEETFNKFCEMWRIYHEGISR